VERLAPLLRARGALRVIVAGRAGEREAPYRAGGVSDFIFAGCDAVATLQTVLAAEGAAS
jgi:methylmalonyl-CoA mutase